MFGEINCTSVVFLPGHLPLPRQLQPSSQNSLIHRFSALDHAVSCLEVQVKVQYKYM